MENLHMNGGSGESSYAENSVIQRKLIGMTEAAREGAVRRLHSEGVVPVEGGAVVIAELGCSTGPNALLAAGEVVSALERLRLGGGEYQVLLNDLPGNDFNDVFRRQLPGFHRRLPPTASCFVGAVPGSFYGRLFPANSLHFLHSSSSLHWLSQVPEGIERSKGKSVESVGIAYREQFKCDFSVFLKSRATELVKGGSMVFTLHGRCAHFPPHYEHCFSSSWHLLDIALTQMLVQGLIEEEKMDTFNRPLYAPSREEIEDVVRKEGSFLITDFTSFEVSSWDINETVTMDDRIRYMVNSMRSGTESLLLTHFGDGLCVDEVFCWYEKVVRKCLTHEMTKLLMFTVSLAKVDTH